MNTLDRNQLNELLASEGGPHVTLLLPPPERPMEAKEDAIRIANAVRDATTKLQEAWMPEQEAEDFLQPLRGLADDRDFLGDRPHGVAIYLSEDCFKVFPCDQVKQPRLLVDRVFHVRPLLPALDQRVHFHVLRLSKQGVTLLGVTPTSVAEVALKGVPESFEASLAGVSADRGSQTHSAAVPVGPAGKQAAVFHGQGGLPDAEKAELTDYLRHLDNAVGAALGDSRDWLVLAGVDFETSIYRNVSAYPRIAEASVVGNMDHLSLEELGERARPIAVAAVERERAAEAEQIRERRHQPVATDPEQVLNAAFQGKVSCLFLDRDAELAGSYAPETATMKEMAQQPSGAPGDPCHDLMEMAAVQTLQHGGRVHAVAQAEMPVEAKLVAALRYE